MIIKYKNLENVKDLNFFEFRIREITHKVQ